jgi:hypothetical protein
MNMSNTDTVLFAIYNPPNIRMILLTVFLVAILVIAGILNNNLLFIVDFIIIVVVAILWIRYQRTHSIRSKYTPPSTTSKDHW